MPKDGETDFSQRFDPQDPGAQSEDDFHGGHYESYGPEPEPGSSFRPDVDDDEIEIADAGLPTPIAVDFSHVDYIGIAEALLKVAFTNDGCRTLQRYRDDYYLWSGSHYEKVSDAAITSLLWKWLGGCTRLNSDKKSIPFNPNNRIIASLKSALCAITYIPEKNDAPFWLSKRDALNVPLKECIMLKRQILHFPTLKVYPATPALFNTTAIPHQYNASNEAHPEWDKYLSSVWGTDAQSIETLQEAMGYWLTQNTKYQKIVAIIGPPRSGKGTVANIVRRLVGESNVSNPTLNSLDGEFGMMQLINKQVAIIGDARVGAKCDQKVVAERLLTVSGGDAISINRKGASFWSGKLNTHLVLMANEIAMLADSSGAFAGRIVPLQMTNSFLGKEDLELEQKLARELPAILMWAIKGLLRLTKRGRFIIPDSAADITQFTKEASSPVQTFIEDRCTFGAGFRVSEHALFISWGTWLQLQGMNLTTKNRLTRDIKAAFPKLNRVKAGTDTREWAWEGIKLKKPSSSKEGK
jgi:putative DNA primase/helicase